MLFLRQKYCGLSGLEKKQVYGKLFAVPELQAAFHGCRKMFTQLQEGLPANLQPEEQDFDFVGCFHDFFPLCGNTC